MRRAFCNDLLDPAFCVLLSAANAGTMSPSPGAQNLSFRGRTILTRNRKHENVFHIVNPEKTAGPHRLACVARLRESPCSTGDAAESRFPRPLRRLPPPDQVRSLFRKHDSRSVDVAAG